MGKSSVRIRELPQLTGRLTSRAIALLPAPLQYQATQRQQIMVLAEEVKTELNCWVQNLHLNNERTILAFQDQLSIMSDAALWTEQRNLWLFTAQRDHDYCTIPTRNYEQGGRPVILDSLRDAGEWKLALFNVRMGGGKKGLPSSFSPVTSINVGISPKHFLIFSFNPFATLI